MNILVTVGTTSFNSLFEALDSCDIPDSIHIECQIANGDYIPKQFPYFRFADDFFDKLHNADAIITHAGAGTVFHILETGKKSLVVANLERADKHQMELARFVELNDYALSVTSLQELDAKIPRLLDYSPKPYQKTEFFRGAELRDKILQRYR